MILLNKKAFTLIEMIIVITVMAILVAGLYMSAKPQKRIGEANDAKRKNDAQSIEQAIKVIATDNGVVATELKNLTENTAYAIVKAGGTTTGTYSCAILGTSINKVDISASLLSVIPAMPIDPDLTSSSNETGYYIIRRGSAYDVEPCNTYRLAAVSGSKQMCGDGYCGSTESCSICPSDCGACPGPQSYTAGPTYPTTGADGGGSYAWLSPTYILLNDSNDSSRSAAAETFPVWYDNTVKIIKSDGSYGTTDKSTGSAFILNSPTITSYGGDGDLWGESWTAADIRDADFGVAFKAIGGSITTNYLKATNFGFSIPDGATITGIKAEIEKYYTGGAHYTGARVDFMRVTVYYTN